MALPCAIDFVFAMRPPTADFGLALNRSTPWKVSSSAFNAPLNANVTAASYMRTLALLLMDSPAVVGLAKTQLLLAAIGRKRGRGSIGVRRHTGVTEMR